MLEDATKKALADRSHGLRTQNARLRPKSGPLELAAGTCVGPRRTYAAPQ
jgi:hypothetical protein